MRKLLGTLLGIFTVGICSAQMVTYLDANGKPFMYSNKVGGQTVYMDQNGKPIAYQMPSMPSGPRIDPINTPSFVFPMISPSLPGSGAITPLAPLPELAPFRGF